MHRILTSDSMLVTHWVARMSFWLPSNVKRCSCQASFGLLNHSSHAKPVQVLVTKICLYDLVLGQEHLERGVEHHLVVKVHATQANWVRVRHEPWQVLEAADDCPHNVTISWRQPWDFGSVMFPNIFFDVWLEFIKETFVSKAAANTLFQAV